MILGDCMYVFRFFGGYNLWTEMVTTIKEFQCNRVFSSNLALNWRRGHYYRFLINVVYNISKAIIV